jgi:surfactin synthase thioesterase subunit
MAGGRCSQRGGRALAGAGPARSRRLAAAAWYTFDALAAAIVDIVSAGVRTVVLGHSLGGVVGLTLAGGRFSVSLQVVVGLGTKSRLDPGGTEPRAGRGAPAGDLVRLPR